MTERNPMENSHALEKSVGKFGGRFVTIPLREPPLYEFVQAYYWLDEERRGEPIAGEYELEPVSLARGEVVLRDLRGDYARAGNCVAGVSRRLCRCDGDRVVGCAREAEVRRTANRGGVPFAARRTHGGKSVRDFDAGWHFDQINKRKRAPRGTLQ